MNRNRVKKYLISICFVCFTALLTLNCGEPLEIVSKYKIISITANPGFCQKLTIRTVNNQDLAFVASGQAGLVIYDIADPSSPAIVAQYMDTLNSCFGVATQGDYAYLAYGKKELEIISIQNLDSIYSVGSFEWPAAYAYDVFAADTNFAYVAAREQFIVAQVTEPAYPNVLGQYRFPSNIRSVVVKDSFAYLAAEQLGVYVMNIKSNPRIVIDACDTPSNARHVFLADSVCFVADGRGGLVIINAADPYANYIISNLHLSGYAQSVFVKDSIAYVACGDAGLAIVNVSDITQPSLIETVKSSYCRSVFVTDHDIIFVADRDQGLLVIKYEE
ncbi:MAG: hypothetical protein KGZ86_03510 [Candidatus Latescibacteria bacterium]|nr:hypothetical protein [Candidatus Latescibacterota bacterium]